MKHTKGMQEIIRLLATHGEGRWKKGRGVEYVIDSDGQLWLIVRADVMRRAEDADLIWRTLGHQPIVRLTEAGRAAV